MAPSRFHPVWGQLGVALFFMITGYLFRSQMLRTAGQPNWLRLYVGRVFRIGPLYLLTVMVMLAIVFSRTGLQLKVPPLQLTREVGGWLLLGSANKMPDVNGYVAWHALSGVTWSLRPEWLFYFSLLITSRAARSPQTHLPFAATEWAMYLACVACHTKPQPTAPLSVYCLLFFSGMLCALLQKQGLTVKLPKAVASALAALMLGVVMSVFWNVYQALPRPWSGSRFFSSSPAPTYSACCPAGLAIRLAGCELRHLYLQGLVLTLVLPTAPIRAFAQGSPVHYWAAILLCAVLLVTIACAAHVLVERPGIRVGKRAALLLEGSAPRPYQRIMRIPTAAGQGCRFDVCHRSALIPAT